MTHTSDAPLAGLKEEMRKKFKEKFMEYSHENGNTLIDSDTDGNEVMDFIDPLLDRAVRVERERISNEIRNLWGHSPASQIQEMLVQNDVLLSRKEVLNILSADNR